MNDFKWHALSEQCSPVFRHISIKFHVCCKSWLGGANELALLAGCSLSSVMVGAMPLHADWFIHSHSLNHFRWTGRCSFHHSHVSSQCQSTCSYHVSGQLPTGLLHDYPMVGHYTFDSLFVHCDSYVHGFCQLLGRFDYLAWQIWLSRSYWTSSLHHIALEVGDPLETFTVLCKYKTWLAFFWHFLSATLINTMPECQKQALGLSAVTHAGMICHSFRAGLFHSYQSTNKKWSIYWYACVQHQGSRKCQCNISIHSVSQLKLIHLLRWLTACQHQARKLSASHKLLNQTVFHFSGGKISESNLPGVGSMLPLLVMKSCCQDHVWCLWWFHILILILNWMGNLVIFCWCGPTWLWAVYIAG